MESLDVKAALDSMLAFVAQNYLIAVLVLVGYCPAAGHARPKPRKTGPAAPPRDDRIVGAVGA